MTDAAREPVTLDEQIAGIERCIELASLIAPDGDKYTAHMGAVLATLQQHKRAMVVVEAVRKWVRDEGSVIEMEDRLCDALDAFDTAEPSEPKS